MPNFNWKKNIRHIPDSVRTKIDNLTGNQLIVSSIKRISMQDIARGLYSHLGITVENAETISESILPNPANGRYSRYNIEGHEVVRRDLPKKTRYYSWEAPNFGDSSKGYHTVTQSREVYQREYYFPKESQIEIVATPTQSTEFALIKFTVKNILDVTEPDFEASLLYDMNLLQENTGVSDVFPPNATISDYLSTIRVNWEILPPGTREEIVVTIMQRMRVPNEAMRQKVQQRFDLLNGLNPREMIEGTTGFTRYFGARFNDSLVVFENLEYGNAIYIMFEDWEILSRLSRSELLRGGYNVQRIVHQTGWERKLTNLITEYR